MHTLKDMLTWLRADLSGLGYEALSFLFFRVTLVMDFEDVALATGTMSFSCSFAYRTFVAST